jgi:hypothetical protein
MKVCIEKSQDGQFSVYKENEQSAEMGAGDEAMPGETPAIESAEQQNKQPARDLNDALMIAGKLLSQEGAQGDGASPFDEGLKSVLPQRRGMM